MDSKGLKMQNVPRNELTQILNQKDRFLKNSVILRKLDRHDEYWKHLCNPDKLSRNGVFLESGMVISWIGASRKPKRILEIGTRTGGSLIALLSTYNKEEYNTIEQILSFDLWREYISTTPVASGIAKLLGKSKNLSLSRRFSDFISPVVQYYSIKKVKRNLFHFNIPADKVEFISGDSTVTVPDYFSKDKDAHFDYVLVDGGHDEKTALQDLNNVVKHVGKNGIIVFDDICPESYNLIGVWNKFKYEHENDFVFFEIHHRKGIAWAIKK